MTKEELREKIDDLLEGFVDAPAWAKLVDEIWAEIEKRDKELIKMASSTRRKEMDLKLELFKASERIKELETQLSYYADKNQNQ